jgi:hypothetical protein
MKSGFVVSLAAFAICATALLPAAARAACPPEPGTLPHDKTTRPDSAAFPADPSNCNFHQWSWHMFLWLTQIDPKTKEPRFLSFAGPDSLHPGIAGPKSTETLMPGLQLTKSKSLKDYLQAGPDGILVDQQGRIVYYSIYLDDVFKKFTVDNSLNTVAGLRAFDPNKAFPVDTLSLKAAWKIVKPGENMRGYYTRKAKINLLKQEGTKIVVDLDKKPVEATVALAGFHIAGTVVHHKEMIWASFENVNNAPDLPQSLNTMRPTDPVSNKSWTFYKKGTQFKDCNVNPANSGTQKLNEKTQVMTPVTQVCRLYPYGSGPDKQGNADNIKLINADVQKQLKDVWRNYFEVGAIWFDTGGGKELQPNCTFQPGSLQCGVVVTGSTHLSNAAIETFTQSQSVFDNCFACHNTVQRFGPTANVDPLPGKNVNISHILNNLYFFLEEKAPQEK